MWAKGKEPGICGNVVWRALRRMRPAGMVFWNAAFKGGIRISLPGSTELAEKVSCSTCYFGRQQLCCLSIEGEACPTFRPVSYTHLRAHETDSYLVCRLLLEKKKKKKNKTKI